MPKQKKKRNKTYTGSGASLSRPVVTRVNAVKRNKIQQWWFERKRIAKPVLITSAVVVIVAWLFLELFRLISGA